MNQSQHFGVVCQTGISATRNSFAALICINISDSVTRVNDLTRLESRFSMTRTRFTLGKMMTQLESRFSHYFTDRVTINDSKLESKSFLQKL